MTEAPDLHFRCEATRIKVRSDGTCVLYCDFALDATSIIDHIDDVLRSRSSPQLIHDDDFDRMKECYDRDLLSDGVGEEVIRANNVQVITSWLKRFFKK